MARPTIEAITAQTLPEFAAFLHANMAQRRSPEEWIAGLGNNWDDERPNFGFLMRDAGRVVGGIGAIYARRTIRGRIEKFCNITSWCVLDSHRKHGMQLAMAVCGQPGYHFTDFSPTKVVAGVLQFLSSSRWKRGGRDSESSGPSWPGSVVTAPQRIATLLAATGADAWRDHSRFPWLNQLVVGTPEAWCHVIYKHARFKRLPCARILHLSDAAVFARHLDRLAWHFLGRGLATTHVEQRFLDRVPRLSKLRTGFTPKLFLSPTLDAADIDYLYCESVALDL